MLKSNWMLIKKYNQIKINRLINLIKLIQISRRNQVINKIQKTILENKQNKDNESKKLNNSIFSENLKPMEVIKNYKQNKNNTDEPIFTKKESLIKEPIEIVDFKNEISTSLLIEEKNINYIKNDNNIDTYSDKKKNGFLSKLAIHIKKENEIKKNQDINKIGFLSKLAFHLKNQNKQNYPIQFTIKYL